MKNTCTYIKKKTSTFVIDSNNEFNGISSIIDYCAKRKEETSGLKHKSTKQQQNIRTIRGKFNKASARERSTISCCRNREFASARSVEHALGVCLTERALAKNFVARM